MTFQTNAQNLFANIVYQSVLFVVCHYPVRVCVFLFFFLHCNWSHPKLPTIQQVIFFSSLCLNCFDRFVAASSVSLINLYLFFNDECEMFSWMYEKENKWWWSCSVKSDLYIQRELSLAVMMLLPEGLHSSTLTTRGRVIKQSHKEHSEEDVSIIFNELNYYFWTTVNWTLIVLLLHLFAFVLFVWNHSFFCGFDIRKEDSCILKDNRMAFCFFS